MQNCKISHDLNPPVESKLSRDILDFIGGFKPHDILQFYIPSLNHASSLAWQANLLYTNCCSLQARSATCSRSATSSASVTNFLGKFALGARFPWVPDISLGAKFSVALDSSLCRAAAPRLRPLQLLLPVRLHQSASIAAPCLHPLQLLLAACVCFSCSSRLCPFNCSPIASTLAAAPDCVCFNCCSPSLV